MTGNGAGNGHDPDLMTPGEVAALFRVDPTTVTKWARAGKLPCVRTLGGHRRYKTAEIRALLKPEPAPDGTARDQHQDITAPELADCQRLQALEDAIAYRRARITAPCPDCTANGPMCDDHACDLNLITAYQRTAITILRAPSHAPAATRDNNPAGRRDQIQHTQPSLPGTPCQRLRPLASGGKRGRWHGTNSRPGCRAR